MRGKLLFGGACGIRYGITPAYAGKTHFCHNFDRIGQDHPRVCGENKGGDKLCKLGTGSPPRMRGKLVGNAVFVPPVRITPAYAGKTCSFLFVECLYKDHPRVCGENLF